MRRGPVQTALAALGCFGVAVGGGVGPAAAQTPAPAPDPAAAQDPAATTIVVEVRDHRGRPVADLPLVLGELLPFGDGNLMRPLAATRQTTDAQGRAAFPRAATAGRNVHVQALVVTEPPVRAPVDPDARAPLRLELPPTGMVRVLVYGEDERPREGVRKVTLRIPGNRPLERLPQAVDLEPEGATFGWVGLDLDLEVEAALAGVSGPLQKRARGPTRAGELVVVDLRVQTAAVVETRLVDPAGAPAAGAEFVAFARAGTRCDVFRLRTDAGGMLRYRVPDWLVADGGELIVRRRGDGVAAAVPTWPAWHGVRRDGDRALAEGPLVAAGVVVDDRGEPVADLELQIDSSWRRAASHYSCNVRDDEHRVRTDAQGRFALHEIQSRGGRLAVRVEGGHCLPDNATIATGDLDQRLVVERAGSATVQLPGAPPGAEVDVLRLQRRVRAGPGSGPPLFAPTVRDGALCFEDLEPGVYDLVVIMSDITMFTRPIATLVSELRVEAGAPCADPRLRVEAWRDHLQPVALRVFDPDGQQVESHVMSYQRTTGGYSGRGFRVPAAGALTRLVPVGNCLALLDEPWCYAVFDAPPATLDVHLRPRPQLELAPPEGLRLPDGVRVRITCDAFAWLRQPGVEVVVHGDRPLRVRPAGTGAGTVTIEVPDGKGGYEEAWRGAIAVADSAQLQAVTLPIDGAAVQAIAAQMPGGR